MISVLPDAIIWKYGEGFTFSTAGDTIVQWEHPTDPEPDESALLAEFAAEQAARAVLANRRKGYIGVVSGEKGGVQDDSDAHGHELDEIFQKIAILENAINTINPLLDTSHAGFDGMRTGFQSVKAQYPKE